MVDEPLDMPDYSLPPDCDVQCSCQNQGIDCSHMREKISRFIRYQHEFFGLPSPLSIEDPVMQYFKSFSTHLQTSDRVFALLGAGFSAGSGLATFRDSGRSWRGIESKIIATPGFFEKHPVIVWLFYQQRRYMATQTTPNAGRQALARLALRKPGCLMIAQNIDALSQRSGHPREALVPIHGSLFTVSCTAPGCSFQSVDIGQISISTKLARIESIDYADQTTPIPHITTEDLPHCPVCKVALLRPGVVFFGEPLPERALSRVDSWLKETSKVDLMLVVGTAAYVNPAAEYIQTARSIGARVAIFNIPQDDEQLTDLRAEDWLFLGDAAVMLPALLNHHC